MPTLATTTIRQLEADLEIAREIYDEIKSQFYSEISLYGDAWPRTKRQVFAAYRTMKLIEYKISAALEEES